MSNCGKAVVHFSNSRGLVGESLFAASIGGPKLNQIIESLNEDAKQIFAPRKSKLRSARDLYKEAVERRKQNAMRITRWQELTKKISAAIVKRDALNDKLRQLRAEENRLERLAAARGSMLRQQRLAEELKQLGDVSVLPNEYSAEQRSRVQTKLVDIRKRVEILEQEIDGGDGLQRQLAEVSIPIQLV